MVSLAHGFHFLSTEVKKKFNNTISLSIYMAFLVGRSLDSQGGLFSEHHTGLRTFIWPNWDPTDPA